RFHLFPNGQTIIDPHASEPIQAWRARPAGLWVKNWTMHLTSVPPSIQVTPGEMAGIAAPHRRTGGYPARGGDPHGLVMVRRYTGSFAGRPCLSMVRRHTTLPVCLGSACRKRFRAPSSDDIAWSNNCTTKQPNVPSATTVSCRESFC